MFIRKALTRRHQGTDYFSFRLVRNERVDGRVKQRALLNLGAAFELPEALWPMFCARMADLLSPQASLVAAPLDARVEPTAQRYAALLQPRSRAGQGLVQKPKAATPVAAAAALAETLDPAASAAAAPADAAPAQAEIEWVDSDSSTYLAVQSIGVETVAMHAVKALGIDSALSTAGFNRVSLAAAIGQLVARMAAPASERRTHRWLQQDSALAELCGFDFGRISLTRMYEIGTRLWSAKPALEHQLYSTLQARFGLRDTVALYDLTNTYFEGLGTRNPSAKRGCSKEKRSDAPLMSLGLVLDQAGFVRRSEVFAGNVYEPSTLEKMLSDLGAAPGALVVLDRGFVNQASLAWLREKGYRYLVMSKARADLSAAAHTIQNAQQEAIRIERIEVTVEEPVAKAARAQTAPAPTHPQADGAQADKAQQQSHPQTALANDTDAEDSAKDSAKDAAKKVPEVSPQGDTGKQVSPQGDTGKQVSPHGDTEKQVQRWQEARLLCHSPARALKENALLTRQQQKMQGALQKIHDGLQSKHGSKTIARVNERIGRIKANHSLVARHYTITLKDDGKHVTAIDFQFQAKADSKADLPGHYVLRSNDLRLSGEQMWRTYIQLTDVESVFRSLKSELGLRPVFHQLETRCKAHLWISVLAYQCVQFLRHELKAKGIHASWTTLREQLHRHHRVSARYQRQDGAFVHIKKNQETPMAVQAIYDALGIEPIKTTKRTFYSNQL